jgi:hypothetical protein
MTVGNPTHGVTNAYPVLLAQHMVRDLGVEAAYVRNLGVGAAHGAVVPALCCESLLTMELSTMAPHDARRVRLQVVNRSDPTLAPTTLHPRWTPLGTYEPADLLLIEFSINGIAWLDVLLARLRTLYPDALMIYVDHFRLLDWRKSTVPAALTDLDGSVTPPANDSRTVSERSPPTTSWADDWRNLSACTAQLAGFLHASRSHFWSLRVAIAARGETYQEALKYFAYDKAHLNQQGHSFVANNVWTSLSPRAPVQGTIPQATLPRAPVQGTGRCAASAVSAAVGVTAHSASPSQTQCYLWYRTKRLPRGLSLVSKHPNWSMRGRLTASSGDSGKFAYELIDPDAATPDQTLTLRFPSFVPYAVVRVAHMLHCCLYGVAELAIDGRHATFIHGSAERFAYHVLEVVTIGRVPTPGMHNLTLRVVRAGGPDGRARQFRLAGLFVSADDVSSGARQSVFRDF